MCAGVNASRALVGCACFSLIRLKIAPRIGRPNSVGGPVLRGLVCLSVQWRRHKCGARASVLLALAWAQTCFQNASVNRLSIADLCLASRKGRLKVGYGLNPSMDWIGLDIQGRENGP